MDMRMAAADENEILRYALHRRHYARAARPAPTGRGAAPHPTRLAAIGVPGETPHPGQFFISC
jgi:hypothetical protein